MASYVVPQVEIHQLFSEIPVALAQNQVSFVFGPNYNLHRFGVDRDALFDTLVTYSNPLPDDSSTSSDPFDKIKPFLTYQSALDPKMVDHEYTKLYGRNVIVKLMDLGSAEPVDIEDEENRTNEIKLSIPSALPEQRGLRVGDYVRLYLDEAGEKYVDTRIRNITKDSGSDSSNSSESSSAESYMYKLTLENGISTTDTVKNVVLCEIQDGIEFAKKSESKYNWKETEKQIEGEIVPGIEVSEPLYAKVVDPYFVSFADSSNSYEEVDKKGYSPVLYAELYLTYRELLTSASDTIHTIEHASDVADALGTIHPDNPLAQGVYNAALNAGGQVVRYMAVPSDNLDGYNKVLDKATLTKEVYFLVPMSRQSTILDAVQAHVNDMSAATTKRWRIAFVSAEIPDEDVIYNKAASTSGREFQAKVVSVNTTQKTAKIRAITDDGNPDPNTKFTRDLNKRTENVFLFNFRDDPFSLDPEKEICDRYNIVDILDSNTIIVSYKDDQAVGIEAGAIGKFEINHVLTNAEKAEQIRNISSSFADRRMYNVFPSYFSTGGVYQTGEFAAACVAGLVSACLPQQPVTNLELVGIDDIPLVYQTFSMSDLNTMASGGTFIVMQDLPNDQVYVRHQISTDYEANNLNTAELSITKNLDSISFFFDNLMSPYIGKYNITPELLAVLENVITGGLVSLESTNYGLYGPQLIADGTEILLLEQDALLKDHVNCNLKLNMPYPFNHLVLKLFV